MAIKKEYIPPQVSSWVEQAKDFAKDLNFRSPTRSTSVIRTVGIVAVAAVAGAALAYFMDPVSGADRRQNLRKKTKDLSDKTMDSVKDTISQAKSLIGQTVDEVEKAAPSVH